ncbi:MAG: UDP-glucose:undecaprenyl-phosphate glucose-1-phosphate transferase [Stenotrophomonas maltophilia]|nr:MAG: UDP-glucose:undecaprenyl-phosphate glucose-1-phosphate transferase [Stenotrophomonas maltophilia]
MRMQSTESLLLARPTLVEYFLVGVRLAHGLTAIMPALIMLALGLIPETETSNFLTITLFFGGLAVMMFQALGIYSEAIFSNMLRFRLMFFAWSSAFGLLLFMHQALKLLPYIPTWNMGLWYCGSLMLFGAERVGMLWAFRRRMARQQYLQNTVILGATESGLRLAEYVQANGDIRSGLIGFIDDRISRLPRQLAGLPLLGDSSDLERLVREERVSQILVALPWSAENRISEIILRLRRLPVNVMIVPDMVALYQAHNRITEVSGLPMFNASLVPLRGWSPLFKRIEDIILSSLAILALSPVMLIVAIAIKLDSAGPVLFRQKRYGYNNRLIEVFKFRSMYTHMTDADAQQQTTRTDPRVTRVGLFIRKTSLDELPQLFNVLGGSMSMVGPRPHARASKAAGLNFEDAVKEYTSRHRVKPGITGWAQINGYRGETDTLEKIEKRVEHDLEYIENWSLWFDLYILFRTVPAILNTKEVY